MHKDKDGLPIYTDEEDRKVRRFQFDRDAAFLIESEETYFHLNSLVRRKKAEYYRSVAIANKRSYPLDIVIEMMDKHDVDKYSLSYDECRQRLRDDGFDDSYEAVLSWSEMDYHYVTKAKARYDMAESLLDTAYKVHYNTKNTIDLKCPFPYDRKWRDELKSHADMASLNPLDD